MTNAGSSNPDELSPRVIWALLIGLMGIAACALVVGITVVGVVGGILFPPRPPLPPDVIETRYAQRAYGDEEWTYTLAQNACEVVQFYVIAGQCTVAPACGQSGNLPTGARMAVCQGVQPFSQFGNQWQVMVDVAQDDPYSTVLKVHRIILWNGVPPTPVATP